MQVFFDQTIFQVEVTGGISRYICELAKALANTGKIKVIIYGGKEGNLYLKELKGYPHITVVSYKLESWLSRKLYRRMRNWLQRRFFNKILKQDLQTIYHPTSYWFDSHIRKKAKGLVITLHDMIIENYFDSHPHNVVVCAEKARAISAADKILTNSKSTQHDLIRYYPKSKTKAYITYLASCSAAISSFNYSNPISLSYFLFIGNRMGYKNGKMVLEAFSLLAQEILDIELIICGGKPLSEDESDFIRTYQLETKIKYLRPSDSELIDLYSRAVALVYPSEYEGFGLPVLEAMHYGCPIIAQKLTSIPEVGGSAPLYLENPTSSQELKEKMKLLLKDPNLRKSKIDLGKDQAKKFSWDITANKTLEVYQQLLNESKTISK